MIASRTFLPFMRCPDPATVITEVLVVEVIVHDLRRATGQVVAIPSIFGCRGVEAASTFERMLRRSRMPGHHLVSIHLLRALAVAADTA